MTMSNGTDAGTIRMHMPLLPSACGGIYAILEAFHGCIIRKMAVLPPPCCSSFLTALMLLLFRPSPASPHAFFIFGDSLVDAGNNDYLVTLSKANAPPYGVDFSFSGGKPTGRFTNGRTIADVIGKLQEKQCADYPCLI